MKNRKPSNHPELGRVVAAVQEIVAGVLEDPMNDYAGYTPDPTDLVEETVQREGFANIEHFEAVVRQRTSARWVHFHLGGYGRV